MRLPADIRRHTEWMLRTALLAALGIALWRSVQPDATSSRVRSVSFASIERELRDALSSEGPLSWELSVDSSLGAAGRDALVALRRAGIQVRWRGAPPPVALEVIGSREPAPRAQVALVGGTASVVLSDSAGPLDTVRALAGATLDVSSLVGRVHARSGAFVASARSPAPSSPRAVLVLGRPSWEAKFVAAALAEAGWRVRARMPAAPGVVVADDGVLPIDTARYDAVIVLDSTGVALGAAIARFVADGGGLVVGGEALRLPPFRALGPATAGERMPGRILLADDTVTPRDLPLRHLTALRHDAVAMQRESSGATLAARRAGLGRVLAVGYDESWRWRMLGGVGGLSAHRDWWSRAVASVALGRDTDRPSAGRDAAPLAALVEALGPAASAVRATDVPQRSAHLSMALLVIIALALLAETASRRFRGAR